MKLMQTGASAKPTRILAAWRWPLSVPLVLWGMALAVVCPGVARAAERGEEVVVVYNSKLPDSKKVAEHYAKRRAVPAAQVFGLDLPTDEAMTRTAYLEGLEKPLLKKLEALKVLTFSPATNVVAGREPFRRVVSATVRYVVLCYGVPSRILKDETFKEAAAANVRPELQRNEAAVDSQLALCPMAEQALPWSGPLSNPLYGSTNRLALSPLNGLLMVCRLDGPSATIALGLVDKALEAESNGLWGRAYFDARGLATNDTYVLGDTYIKVASDAARQLGFETVLEQSPATFPAGFPMSHIAIYAGWYDQAVSGPFTLPKVEFMPGAFAYHLYSFSAQTIRGTSSWVGTFLSKGATCTLGAVDEPYLDGTPDISLVLARLMFSGYTFGEAAYVSQTTVSWQTTVIGDPLYRPFGVSPDQLQGKLEKEKSKMLEWFYLVAVNQQMVRGARPADAIRALEGLPLVRESAVLTEKLADLYWSSGSMLDAADTYEGALKRNPSPAQRMRLLLTAAERRGISGPDDVALGHYKTFLKENPDYPELLKIYQQMLPIARRRNMTEELAKIEAEIKRLTPAPAPVPGEK